MGKKYIVKLDDNKLAYTAIIIDGVPYIKPLQLLPYTEPDMEQVRKEVYQKGLSDAWEAARKVTQVRKYGGYGDCLGDVFGRTDTSWDVFDYSASEAIEKIRQYEQEKEEQDGLRQNIQIIVDQCGYTLDEIASVLQKMRES